ncbi:hypothetical protein CEP54_015396 [Fusarium duplospermum]|uniref:Uncharacterized protein n=1 Tax=Fusarium duplospermum TaxID=1325734 RepID=A0A428NPJ0_9HYPO|nr:hypothetical protein CEP54_015396 [Fusarium duplospermum]
MSTKRTILLTGCSDGSLGSALAIALHKRDCWRVIASARNPSKLTDVKNLGIECVQLDVGSEESIAAAVERVKELTGGTLDALVNNAGTGYSTPIIHIDIEKAHDLFELNVFSIIRVTRAFLSLLLKSDRNPLIINNTSGSSLLGCAVPFQGAYGASKAAATSITESLRIELDPFGIRVINLLTGGVNNAFHANSPHARLPEDSIYNLAKEDIEETMFGKERGLVKPDATTWANQVAADLSQRKPPYLISRGGMAGTARIATLLPIGLTDSTLKKTAGIDVLEKKIKEKGGLDKIKHA